MQSRYLFGGHAHSRAHIYFLQEHSSTTRKPRSVSVRGGTAEKRSREADRELVREFESRSRILKLRAASNPFTLLMFRLPAGKLVKLSKSDSVSGPLGFCSA